MRSLHTEEIENNFSGNTGTIIWNPDDYFPGNEIPQNERL